MLRQFISLSLNPTLAVVLLLSLNGCISITRPPSLTTPTQSDFDRAAEGIRETAGKLIETYNGSFQGKTCSDARGRSQTAVENLQPTLQRLSDLLSLEGSEQLFGTIAAYPDIDVDPNGLTRPQDGAAIQVTRDSQPNARAFESGRITISLGLIRGICAATEPEFVLEDLREAENFEAPTLISNGEELFQWMEVTSPMADMAMSAQVALPAAQQEFVDALIFVLAHEHLHVYQFHGNHEYDHPKTREVLADYTGIMILEATRGQFRAEGEAQRELERTFRWNETDPQKIANLAADKGYVTVLENVYVKAGFRESSEDYLPLEERIASLEEFGRRLSSEVLDN